MRRIDKKLNMMKVNLLAESRYLESKGLLSEVVNIDSDDDFKSLNNIIDYGDSEKSRAFRNVIDALKKIKNKITPKDSGIGTFLKVFKELAEDDEYEKVKSVSSDIIRKHEEANKDYKKYEEVEWVGGDKEFNNGKTLKNGDLGKFIGAQNDEECVVGFPSVGLNITTSFKFIKKIDNLNEFMLPITDNYGDPKMAFAENEVELEENIFKNTVKKVKDFGNRVLGIPSKEEEAKKQKAIQEIDKFIIGRLFLQTNNLDASAKKSLADRVDDAAKYMPTLEKLRPDLFNTNNIDGTHVYMKNEKGDTLEGFIPSSFWLIRGQNDFIDSTTAKGKLEGYLNVG